MTREERELITTPEEIFHRIAEEYGSMSKVCVSDIKNILHNYFPHEDPRFIDAVATLVHARCEQDVIFLVEKLKDGVVKVLGR